MKARRCKKCGKAITWIADWFVLDAEMVDGGFWRTLGKYPTAGCPTVSSIDDHKPTEGLARLVDED